MPADQPPSPDAVRYASEISALVARYGEVPPLWSRFPRIHPFDINWRMGAGEDYRYLFHAWSSARAWSREERVAYIQRWDPPYSWLDWVASFIWPEDDEDSMEGPSEERFAELERLGLGSRADWERCSGVDPDQYPLEDDDSTGWLEADPTTPEG